VRQSLSLASTDYEGNVVDAVIKCEFIEQPHDIFAGLPVCPFARAARLKQTIRFEVRRRFALDDPLEPTGDIPKLTSSSDTSAWEVLRRCSSFIPILGKAFRSSGRS
jgi:hypothetical protein